MELTSKVDVCPLFSIAAAVAGEVINILPAPLDIEIEAVVAGRDR